MAKGTFHTTAFCGGQTAYFAYPKIYKGNYRSNFRNEHIRCSYPTHTFHTVCGRETATTKVSTDIHLLLKSIQLRKYSYTTEYIQIPMNMKLSTKEPTSFSKLTDHVW